MIIDAATVRDGETIHADVCIIGAGPAGLTLAERLSHKKMSICVLESGGLKFEWKAQNLSKGTVTGQPYEALHLCRIRQFGGSTGPKGWGGWCKTLQQSDFEERPWVPLSGWPIDLKDLTPHYEKAFASLGLPTECMNYSDNVQFSNASLEAESCFLAGSNNILKEASERALSSSRIKTFIHSTACQLESNKDGSAIESVLVKTSRKKEVRIFSRIYVLACGGIENARLMLASNRRCPNGIGNGFDVVGRYFMEHPAISWGRVTSPEQSSSLDSFDPAAVTRRANGKPNAAVGELRAAGLVIPPKVLEKEQILSSRSWLKPMGSQGFGDGARALQEWTFWLRKGRVPADTVKYLRDMLCNPRDAFAAARYRASLPWKKGQYLRFVTIMEQEPTRQSRVTLSGERDSLGLPKAQLDWHLGPLVERTFRRTQELLIDGLRSAGYDCSIEQLPRHSRQASFRNSVRWVRHHMGTTRMSADPRYGVVDRDCQVHGVDNLFIAGSSVFPTGGNDMPTLTIVALAHRLAEHLSHRQVLISCIMYA